MEDEKFTELTEEELDQAAGGGGFFLATGCVKNSQGFKIGVCNKNKIYYYPCEKCGKPTYKRFLDWYCEPCNKVYFQPSLKRWTGTEDELKAAAN